MKTLYSFAALAVTCLVAGNAQLADAAILTGLGNGVGGLDLTGDVKALVNFGGPNTDVDVSPNIRTFVGQLAGAKTIFNTTGGRFITGDTEGVTVSNDAISNYNGGGATYAGDDVGLNPLLQDVISSNAGTTIVTLSGLDTTKKYNLQLLFHEGFGSHNREATITNTVGAATLTDYDYLEEQSGVGPIPPGVGILTQGTIVKYSNFTADSTTETVSVAATSSLNVISGLVLTQVPEPSSFALAGLSLVGLVSSIRRRRKRA